MGVQVSLIAPLKKAVGWHGTTIASLAQLLNFGTGVITKTASAALITVDIYGRIRGFEAPDNFYYTMTAYTSSANQTVFSVTRGAGYVTGNSLIFENGCLLNPSEYTDSAHSVTLAIGANLNDIITIISVKSSTGAGTVYASFTRNQATLNNDYSYTPSFTLNSGYELLFLNGTVINAQDYNISGQVISFVNSVSGDLQVIQWSQNNLGVANGTPVNVDAFTVIGQTIYPFSYNINAFNLFSNGALLKQGTDYTTSTGTYTLGYTPDNITTIMVQQTFARTGAV